MPKTIGIDLGTTRSSCAYIKDGSAVIIPNAEGDFTTPSTVSFTNKGAVLIGESAKNNAILNSSRTVEGIKREMGKEYSITIDDKIYIPEQISSFILSKLKNDAEKYIGEKIKDAVITVPAYFSDSQRQATVDAGKIAGLNVLRIINEPTAAALAYGLGKSEGETILVYDLGGGTFDVSILEIEGGLFEVRAAKGNNCLGGMDFDKRLLDFIVYRFKEETGTDLSKDKLALNKLSEEVEKVKIALSDETEAELNVPFISADENGPLHLSLVIARESFEKLIEDYIDETVELALEALEEADTAIDSLDKIILVGGSSLIPLVRSKLEEAFGEKIVCGVDPILAVAKGAAIQCGIINGDIGDITLVDVTPLSLGIETDGGVFVPIIERNTAIPTEQNKIFATIEDNQEDVEVHILQGERRLAKENISLGKFILSGIKKAKRGETKIEVKFSIDVNSIVSVSARDMETGLMKSIKISAKTGLSNEDIRNLIRDSNINSSGIDYIRLFELNREANEIIDKAENLASRKEFDLIAKNDIYSLIDEVKRGIDEKDADKIEKSMTALKDFYEEAEFILNDETIYNVKREIYDNIYS
ncbi:MAG TPA: molecular chaperone DnaK [Spirochaetota bacterium]|nr:molecular chaperone DnaK [Spirochaetota bacterium]HOS32949.1 molecular chaperone DnaK [Spirochaetota bacterium]HOS54885.1 molecular chaperone DnaK [Spirochaetota bacterium]HPK62960.1 molecular chaperone DnaK [Spirochaetota bacterium]HQF77807.1 molecular chaperone DnaK [Spirochaetota bacterium]